jgi:hypothetical protein
MIAVAVIGTITLSSAGQEPKSEVGLQGTALVTKDTGGPGISQPRTSAASTPNVPDQPARTTIVIGFVGGFVQAGDLKHPEVQFASYLRNRYPSDVHAEVFSNHDGRKAFHYALSLLDTDHDGTLSAAEKDQAKIIIYGHSWGASETVSLARDLGRIGIPVLLTIQVDTIAKPGQNGSTISPNVAKAVNFYQPRGILHGRTEILAAAPVRTKIIGNIRMTYEDYPVNCENYRWYARVFNKPHHEIENDPRVWDQAALLIDSELSDTRSTVQSSSPSQSPFFSFLYDHHR